MGGMDKAELLVFSFFFFFFSATVILE